MCVTTPLKHRCWFPWLKSWLTVFGNALAGYDHLLQIHLYYLHIQPDTTWLVQLNEELNISKFIHVTSSPGLCRCCLLWEPYPSVLYLCWQWHHSLQQTWWGYQSGIAGYWTDISPPCQMISTLYPPSLETGNLGSYQPYLVHHITLCLCSVQCWIHVHHPVLGVWNFFDTCPEALQ